jgi:hypothetical protein
MAKIDEIKEVLNTLRIAMSIGFGMLVVVVGSIVNRYDENKTDIIFWIGVGFVFFLLSFLVMIIKKISDRTKEIKEM